MYFGILKTYYRNIILTEDVAEAFYTVEKYIKLPDHHYFWHPDNEDSWWNIIDNREDFENQLAMFVNLEPKEREYLEAEFKERFKIGEE